MAKAQERDVLPDLLKALLILSVLLQHSATALKTGLPIGEGNWTNWLSASPFNMPLFMAICGYYFFYSAQRRSLAELLKSKLLMIMVPCLAWTMLGKCAGHFLYGLNDWMPWPWSLWFLWSALICMLLGSICHYAFRRMEGWMMALLCGLLCLVPFDPYNVAYMFPFFAMGYVVCKHNLVSKAKPWMGWVALAAYIGLHCFITKESSAWDSHSFLFGERPVEVQLGLNAYRFLIGVAGSIAFVFIISRLYYACCAATPPLTSVWQQIKRYVMALGQYSLVVYASQAVILELCTGRLVKMLAWRGWYNPQAIPFQVFQWVCIPLTAFIVSLLCLAALRLAQTNRITRFLFIGKA